jgi:hypothetical protein
VFFAESCETWILQLDRLSRKLEVSNLHIQVGRGIARAALAADRTNLCQALYTATRALGENHRHKSEEGKKKKNKQTRKKKKRKKKKDKKERNRVGEAQGENYPRLAQICRFNQPVTFVSM